MATDFLSDPAFISPNEALMQAEKGHGSLAAKIIMGRLRGDFLVATAAKTSDLNRRPDPEIYNKPAPVPASFWNCLQDESVFWSAGDAHFFWEGRDGETHNVRCSGIRFLRKVINQMFPVPETVPAATATIELPEKHLSVSKKKAVSDAALRIWAEAFAKIYKDTDILQPSAVKSAEGMFPDNSVSRDRAIEALKAAGVTFSRGPKKQISGK